MKKKIPRKNQFSSTYQPNPENISKGMIESRKKKLLLEQAREQFSKANIIPKLIKNIQYEVDEGINKNAIELLKILKETETQQVNIKGAFAGVHKIFVTKEEDLEARKHIKDVLENDC